MHKLTVYSIVILLVLSVSSFAFAVGETVITEQNLKEKVMAKRILDMYLTDAGIKGFELNSRVLSNGLVDG